MKISLKWKVLTFVALLIISVAAQPTITPATFESFWDRMVYWMAQSLTHMMFAIALLIRINPCVYTGAGVGGQCTYTMGPFPLLLDLDPTIREFNTKLLEIFVPLYILLFIILGFYLIFMQGSPQGRVRAKATAIDLLIGMILVSLSPMIFQLMADISGDIVDRMISLSAVNILELNASFNNPGAICTLAILFIFFFVILVLAFFVVLARYFALMILAAIFPLTLFFYSFMLTKSLGNSLLKFTLLVIFSQIVMALFLVMGITSVVGGGGGIDSLIFSLASFVAMLLTPLIMMKLMGWLGATMFAYSSRGGPPFTRAIGRMMRGYGFGDAIMTAAGRYDTTYTMGIFERGGERPATTAFDPWANIDEKRGQVVGFPKGRTSAAEEDPYFGRAPMGAGASVMAATGGFYDKMGGNVGVGGLQRATPSASARASKPRRVAPLPSARRPPVMKPELKEEIAKAERLKEELKPPEALERRLPPKPPISAEELKHEGEEALRKEQEITQMELMRQKHQQMLRKISREYARAYKRLGLNDEDVTGMASELPEESADNFFKVMPHMAEPLERFDSRTEALRDVVNAGKENPDILKGGKNSKAVKAVKGASGDKNPNKALKDKLETPEAKEMRTFYAEAPATMDLFNMISWKDKKAAWKNLRKISEKRGGMKNFVASKECNELLRGIRNIENPDETLKERAGVTPPKPPRSPEAPSTPPEAPKPPLREPTRVPPAPEKAPPTPSGVPPRYEADRKDYDKNRKVVGQLLGKDMLTEFDMTFKKEPVKWTTMKNVRELSEILRDRPDEVRSILRKARSSERPETYVRNTLKELRAKEAGEAPPEK